MPLLRLLPVLLLLSACGDATGANALHGAWVGERHTWNDGWSPRLSETRITFGRDGGYRIERRHYGGYGKPGEKLTFFTYTVGKFRTEGDSIFLRLTERVTWDSFYGEDRKPEVTSLSPAEWRGFGTFQLSGDRLTLTYYTYPLDAPELTRTEYRRAD